MANIVNRTVDSLLRFGEKLERRLSTDETNDLFVPRSGSNSMFPSKQSAFRRPLDRKPDRSSYSSERRPVAYGRQHRSSSDNLAGSPAYSSFRNYRQNPSSSSFMYSGDPSTYTTSTAAPFMAPTAPFMAPTATPSYNPYSNHLTNSTTPYASSFASNPTGYSAMPYSSNPMPYGVAGGMAAPANIGYAPEYYIAERRQVELVPAPPPRIVQQPVPYPVPVDRPVPQPYPVEVTKYVPVDRPVPVPVPTPVPVDRPVAVPVPVPSPPPPPVCVPVPVPVPSPVPCYIPVGVPVPSPPASPVMFEQSVTNTQRWVTGSPVFMNQGSYVAASPVVNSLSSYGSYGNGSFIRY